MYCPFGIDMAVMVSAIRGILTSQGMAPKGLLDAIKNYQDSGNQMAVSQEDWVELCSGWRRSCRMNCRVRPSP